MFYPCGALNMQHILVLMTGPVFFSKQKKHTWQSVRKHITERPVPSVAHCSIENGCLQFARVHYRAIDFLCFNSLEIFCMYRFQGLCLWDHAQFGKNICLIILTPLPAMHPIPSHAPPTITYYTTMILLWLCEPSVGCYYSGILGQIVIVF